MTEHARGPGRGLSEHMALGPCVRGPGSLRMARPQRGPSGRMERRGRRRAIPVTAEDARQRLHLLRLVVQAMGTQAEVADILGVDSSTMSRFVSREKHAPEWHVVYAAIRGAIKRYPDLASVFVAELASELFGVHGRWLPGPKP